MICSSAAPSRRPSGWRRPWKAPTNLRPGLSWPETWRVVMGKVSGVGWGVSGAGFSPPPRHAVTPILHQPAMGVGVQVRKSFTFGAFSYRLGSHWYSTRHHLAVLFVSRMKLLVF